MRCKCQICKKPTDWDTSYGFPEFIVCAACHDRFLEAFGWREAMEFIFIAGELRQKAINEE